MLIDYTVANSSPYSSHLATGYLTYSKILKILLVALISAILAKCC